MKTKIILSALVIAHGGFTQLSHALSIQVPYSGQLAENGELVNGTKTMKFQILDAEFAGTARYDSGPTTVPVSGGAFSVVLGGSGVNSLDSSVFDGNPRWLEISVGNTNGTNLTILMPRQPVRHTPHSAFAVASGSSSNAATLGGFNVASFARLGASNNFTGFNSFSGVDFTPGAVTFQGQPVDFAGTEASFLASSTVHFLKPDGTAPFKVSSSTKVENLNADKLNAFSWHDHPLLRGLNLTDWAAPGPVAGGFPGIRLRGTLTDVAGEPREGLTTVTARIYSAPTGGTPLHAEQFTSLLTAGSVDLVLGVGSGTATGDLVAALTPAPRQLPERYLTLHVEGDVQELMPRRRITAGAYATLAMNAQSLGTFPAESYARLDNTNAQTFSGPTTFSTGPTFAPTSGPPPFTVNSSTLVPNLNADRIDGVSAEVLARTDMSNIYTQAQRFRSGIAVQNSGGTQNYFSVDADGQVSWTGTAQGNISGTEADFLAARFNQAQGTAPFTVSSSTVVPNLNADVLDGVDSAVFARKDAANTFTGPQTFQAGSPGIVVTGTSGTLQEWQNGATTVASVGVSGFSGSGSGLTSLNADNLSSGTVGPAQGGIGIDTASAATGSILFAPGSGTWATLPPGNAGQVLKMSSGVPTWGTDDTGGGGSVTSITAGTGLVTSPPSGITTSGSISIDTSVVPRLNVANIFTDTTTLQASAPSSTPLVVQGAAAQTANLQVWQNSAGSTVASVSPAGRFSGDGSGLVNITATTLAGGTHTGQYTFNNGANSFTGSLSGNAATATTAGSATTAGTATTLAGGTHSGQYTFNNAANIFSGTHSGDGAGLTGVTPADNSISTAKLQDGCVIGAKLSTANCTAGQVWKFNGTSWACADDNDTTYSAGAGLNLSGTTFSLADGGVTTAKLADAAVTGAKLASTLTASGALTLATSGNGNSLTLQTATGAGTENVSVTADENIQLTAVNGSITVNKPVSGAAAKAGAANAGATPSVANLTVLQLDGYFVPTTVIDLLDGVDGQVLVIVAGNNPAAVTVSDDSSPMPGNFRLRANADWRATPNHTLTLCRMIGVWFETARSEN